MDKNKNRRQFLKNTSLTALSLGLIPVMGQCKTPNKATKDPALMCDPTTLDYYGAGPFYTANPPTLSDNKLASDSEAGTRMIISGRVFNLDCNQAIPNTIIDIWQANDAGAYDNAGYNLRGQVLSNEQGFYMFETIQPGKYLNGSSYRPSHIHFKITPPGFNELTTQLYFEGDTDIPADAAASITSGNFDASHRIISLTANNEGVLEGTWDIVINGEGINVSTQNLHLDKGMVYGVSPNPFTNTLTIKYGVFKKSKVSLLAFDLNGKKVATLEERELQPEKYEATWNPSANLPNGHYFIVLKVNDLQIHYLKVLKQR
jgi:protocatechuate 3,4-dioxygenase beta subunit